MIDHLVLATPDLTGTVSLVAALTGVEPVPGGRHVGLGTRNFLLGLGGAAYLEIVGPDPEQPTPDRPRPLGVDDLAEAQLVTWAIRVDDVDGRVRAARAAGFDPGPVRAVSRRGTDGQLVQGRVSMGPDGRHTGLLPFLVDWGTTPHPAVGLPVVPLVSLVGLAPRPEPVRRGLRALGAELEIRPGSRPALLATVRGAGGEIVLF